MTRIVVLTVLAALASCATGGPRVREACIRHTDQYGVTFERILVLGEHRENAWEYDVQYPDSNLPYEVFNVKKDKVMFWGCPATGKVWVGRQVTEKDDR